MEESEVVDAAGRLVFGGLEFDIDCLFAFDEICGNLIFLVDKTVFVPFAYLVDFGGRSVVKK